MPGVFLNIFTKSRSRIPEVMEVGKVGTERAVETTARNIQTIAALKSRYEFGNMRAGWDAEEIDGSVEIGGRDIEVDFGEGNAAWRVFNNVYYTIYNEYGTVNMSAQPMLTPAIEMERPEFERRVREAWA